MIKCPDCEKEISDSAPSCPHCGRPIAANQEKTRSVGVLLGVGIFLIPIVFAWFTLRKGHTTKAKAIAFGWLVLSIVAVGMQGPSSTSAPVSEGRHQAASKTAAAPAMEVNIREILSAYQNNEVGADNQYKGKVIEVTGIVDDIKKDIMNNLYVTLGTGAEFQIPQIQAFFDDSMNDQLGQLRKRQQLTVVCRVDGLMMNVLARDCLIKN